jgi:DNA-binding response OmpR family regulator
MDLPKVLVVEDNRLLRWWMTSSLEHAGFAVEAPETFSEALQICDSAAIEMLVTDWHLREQGDGFEVLEHARRHSPKVFAVLISAEADAELTGAARTAGFDVVIQKPFPVAEIVGAVHAYQEKSHSQRAEVA